MDHVAGLGHLDQLEVRKQLLNQRNLLGPIEQRERDVGEIFGAVAIGQVAHVR